MFGLVMPKHGIFYSMPTPDLHTSATRTYTVLSGDGAPCSASSCPNMEFIQCPPQIRMCLPLRAHAVLSRDVGSMFGFVMLKHGILFNAHPGLACVCYTHQCSFGPENAGSMFGFVMPEHGIMQCLPQTRMRLPLRTHAISSGEHRLHVWPRHAHTWNIFSSMKCYWCDICE